MKLENKVALITGGNSGIGLATARRFVAEGARVVVTGRNRQRLEQVATELGPNVVADHDFEAGLGPWQCTGNCGVDNGAFAHAGAGNAWVRNDTDEDRLILLCDVERPLRYRWAQWINRAFSKHVMSAAASANEDGDKSGVIGRMFRFAHLAGTYRKRFKRWSPPTYYGVRAVLIIGVLAAIVFV